MNIDDGGLSWELLVALTCKRLSEDSGEDIVHGVDVSLGADPSGDVRYTALTEKGDRALRILMLKMKDDVQP